MACVKYLLFLWLISAPTISANPASNVVAKSTVDIGISKLRLAAGESRTITCNPGGNPLPTIKWAKTGGTFGPRTYQNGNALFIYDADVKDGGVYSCLGLVDRRIVAQQHLTIEIEQLHPTVSPSVRFLGLQPGATGFVDCTPAGSPLPRVQWTKGEGRFNNGTVQVGNKLIIADAQYNDQGIYVCNGIVDSAVVWSASVKVELIKSAVPSTQAPATLPPVSVATAEETTTLSPSNTPRIRVLTRILRITRGHSGAIDCNAEGSPLPRVEWNRETTVFGIGTRQSGNTLVISNAQDSDAGYYVCNGILGEAPVWTEYVKVEIRNPPSSAPAALVRSDTPRAEVNTRKLKIVRGQSAAVDCNPKGSPLPTIQWNKEGTFGSNIRIDGHTLVISQAEDGDAGNYLCYGIVDRAIIWTDYVQVEIVDDDSAELDILISQYDALNRCDVEYDHDDQALSESNQVGSELVIRIAPKTIGYHCKVSSRGFAIRHSVLRLESLPASRPPRVVVRPAAPVAAQGQALFVECVLLEGHDALVHWERLNGSLSSRAEARGHTLIFHRIEPEDEGSYRCIARSAGGLVSETTKITVKEAAFEGSSPHGPKVSIVKRSNAPVKIQRGYTGSLYCKSLGTPLPSVQWKRTDGSLRDGIKQEGNYLIISNATDSDSGDYVCDGLVESTPVWTDYVRVLIYDRCEQPRMDGSAACRGYHTRWFYDNTYKICRKFYYSGCGGNQNNFISETQCRLACDVTRRTGA